MPNSKYVLLQVLLFAYYFDYFQVFYLNTKHAAIFPRTKIEQKWLKSQELELSK